MLLLLLLPCSLAASSQDTSPWAALQQQQQPGQRSFQQQQQHLSRNVRHPEAVLATEFAQSPNDNTLAAPVEKAEESIPANQKLILGNWIAQWDKTYQAWFFYNIKTEESTWVKPAELAHVVFNAPTQGLGAGGPGPQARDKRKQVVGPRSSLGQPYSGPGSLYSQAYPSLPYPGAQDKVLLESTTGDFFGFNTTGFQSRGVLGGMYDSLSGIYDNIVKSYVEAVYTDVIEGYTIATIKLFGWFFFGSFLIAKGALLNGLNEGRSFDGPSLTETVTGVLQDGGAVNYTIPFLQPLGIEGLSLTFPVDNSLLSCYQGRATCMDNNLPQEMSQLLSNVRNTWDFGTRWLELSEKIGHMAMEGETEL